MKTTREESDSKRALSPCKPQPSEGYEKQRQSSGRGGQQATLPHTPGDHSAWEGRALWELPQVKTLWGGQSPKESRCGERSREDSPGREGGAALSWRAEEKGEHVPPLLE